jgi:hypothetical protein
VFSQLQLQSPHFNHNHTNLSTTLSYDNLSIFNISRISLIRETKAAFAKAANPPFIYKNG